LWLFWRVAVLIVAVLDVIQYLGHPLVFTENFTEIVPGNPYVEGVKRKRGSQI